MFESEEELDVSGIHEDTEKPAAIMQQELKYQDELNQYKQQHKEANAHTEEKQILKQFEDKIVQLTNDMMKTKDQNGKFRLAEELKKEKKMLDSFKAEQKRKIKKTFNVYRKRCLKYQDELNQYKQQHKEANAHTEEKQILKQFEDKIVQLTSDMMKTKDKNAKFRLAEELKKENKMLDSFKAEQKRKIMKTFNVYRKRCNKLRMQHIGIVDKLWEEELERAGTQRPVPVMAAKELESNSWKDYHTHNVEKQGTSSEIPTGKRKRTELTTAIPIKSKRLNRGFSSAAADAKEQAMPSFASIMLQTLEGTVLPPPNTEGEGKPTAPWYQEQHPMKQLPVNWRAHNKYEESVRKEAEKTKEEEQTTSEPVDTGNAIIQSSDDISAVCRELEQLTLGPSSTKLPIKLAYKLNHGSLWSSPTKLPIKLAYKLNRASVTNIKATSQHKHVSDEGLIQYTCTLMEGMNISKKVGKVSNLRLAEIGMAKRKALIDVKAMKVKAKKREQSRKKLEPNQGGNETPSKFKGHAEISDKRARKVQQFKERQQQAAKEEKRRLAAAKEASKKEEVKKEGAKRKTAAPTEAKSKEADSKAKEHKRMQKQNKEPSDAEKHAAQWKHVTKEYEEKKSTSFWRPC